METKSNITVTYFDAPTLGTIMFKDARDGLSLRVRLPKAQTAALRKLAGGGPRVARYVAANFNRGARAGPFK